MEPSTNRKKSKQEKKEKIQLNPNTMVSIQSGVKGGLTYKSTRTGQIWRFLEFGDQEEMELSELRTMLSSNRSFLEKGWIKVLDDDVVEYLNLERFKKAQVDVDDIEQLLKLEADKIKLTIDGANSNTKIFIYEIAKDKYLTGELRDIHIINAIEEGLGQKLDPNK